MVTLMPDHARCQSCTRRGRGTWGGHPSIFSHAATILSASWMLGRAWTRSSPPSGARAVLGPRGSPRQRPTPASIGSHRPFEFRGAAAGSPQVLVHRTSSLSLPQNGRWIRRQLEPPREPPSLLLLITVSPSALLTTGMGEQRRQAAATPPKD